MLFLLDQLCAARGGLDGCAAPLLIWVNAVLTNEARATYRNQSGLQLIRAVGARSGSFPSFPSCVAEGHKGQEKKRIGSDLNPWTTTVVYT